VKRQRRLYDLRTGHPVSRKCCEAIHEAGHTIAALDLKIRVLYVTLVDESGDGAGGCCEVIPPRWLIGYFHGRKRTRELFDPYERRVVRAFLIQGRAGYLAERELVELPPHPFWIQKDDTDAAQTRVCARLLGVRGRKIKPFVETFDDDVQEILVRRWRSKRLRASSRRGGRRGAWVRPSCGRSLRAREGGP
jgi:hypothetical protein